MSDIITILRQDLDKARAQLAGRKAGRYSPAADAQASLEALDALVGVVERVLTYAETLAALGALPGLSRPPPPTVGWAEPSGFVFMRRPVGMVGGEVQHEERLFREDEAPAQALDGWERRPEPEFMISRD